MFHARVPAAAAMLAAAGAAMLAGCAPTHPAAHDGNPAAPGSNAKPASGQTMNEVFAGKFPGVQVFRAPGGGISLRIRGAGTLSNPGEPLYVIDGTRIGGGHGGLLFLDPADIASIEVLKDIASTSFYGIHGANGVVLITTKRGR